MILLFVSYLAGIIGSKLLSGDGVGLGYLLFGKTTFMIACMLLAVFVIIYLVHYDKKFWITKSKELIAGNVKDSEIQSNFEQEHFQTREELEKNFRHCRYSHLNAEKAGLPIRTELKNGELEIFLAEPSHALIIGTTGSGKTTMFIDTAIQVLSESGEKPSMLIADPKGELYSQHAESLRRKGYTVRVLDLRNPFESVKWNPLERPYLLYQQMLNLESLVVRENGKTCFQGREYDNVQLKIALQMEKQRLYDKVYEDLHDTISVLCPILNKNEPIWESGARNLILAIAIAMLEDSANPELGMTVEKYNFYNLTRIATNTEEDCAQLKDYFRGRSELSKAIGLSKQVLDSAEKTRGSYLSTMFDKLNLFSDMGVCSLTSKNEIDFSTLADRPTVLFLQIPDEKETRHPLASMMILQAYKQLVERANLMQTNCLPRGVYFLLDEFGNIPPISKIEQMITVGRSRNLWFCLVIQSYSQLARVYDEKIADILKSNCNIQIFIGTSDIKTVEEYSKRCGNYNILTRNIGYHSKESEISSNISLKERPLIYPSELIRLNGPTHMGNAIVTVFGYPPIYSHLIPSFQCPVYVFYQSELQERSSDFFDEERIYYDMKQRNKVVLGDSERERGCIPILERGSVQLKHSLWKILSGTPKESELESLFRKLDSRDYAPVLESLKSIRDFEPQKQTWLDRLIYRIEKLKDN